MEQVKGKYKVVYKYPLQDVDRRRRILQGTYGVFEGVCENFSTHLSAFSNDNGQMLLVDYDDIIQMRPIKD